MIFRALDTFFSTLVTSVLTSNCSVRGMIICHLRECKVVPLAGCMSGDTGCHNPLAYLEDRLYRVDLVDFCLDETHELTKNRIPQQNKSINGTKSLTKYI